MVLLNSVSNTKFYYLLVIEYKDLQSSHFTQNTPILVIQPPRRKEDPLIPLLDEGTENVEDLQRT